MIDLTFKEWGPYKCPDSNCGQELPRDYVENNEIPKASVGLVGFTGHGKSVFLTSLFYVLELMENIWVKYYDLACDDNTHRILFEDLPRFKASYLPDATPIHFPQPALIRFCHIPLFGDLFLGFYDTAGEVFEQTQRITDQGRFVVHSDVIFFIISLPDAGEHWTDCVSSLLNTYIRAVYDQVGVNLKKSQDLILVFTKMDKLLVPDAPLTLPDELQKALLKKGTYSDYLNLQAKLSEIRGLSASIKKWLKHHSGKGIVTLCEEHFRRVEYTIVSATGAAPQGNRLATKLKPEDPKRVLDPFLWALEMSCPKTWWERIFGWALEMFCPKTWWERIFGRRQR